MPMKYFDYSQKVKEEVQQTSGMVEALQEFLSGSPNLDMIGEGTRHHVFRVGQLPSGMWVALRNYDLISDMLPEMGMSLYESYCLDAEELSDEGKRVPAFCVGGILHNGDDELDALPILLVEDLTEGRKYKVCSEDVGKAAGYRVRDKKREEVWFDLGLDGAADVSSNVDVNSFKYFHPSARLNLE